MAPGPIISRYERPSAERRPDGSTREAPDEQSGVFASLGTVCGLVGGTPAPAAQGRKQLRLVHVDNPECAAQVLKGRAGERVRILRREIQLYGDAGRPLGQPETD